jgi:hypothetical protein
MKWENKGHQLDGQAKAVAAAAQHDIYIYGAGLLGKNTLELLTKYGIANVKGFIDRNVCEDIFGLPAHKPEYLSGLRAIGGIVLVASSFTKEIFGVLERYSFIRGVDCFHVDDFIIPYLLYNRGLLFLSYSETWVSDFCVLKCKNCLQLNPYYPNKSNYDFDEFKYDIAEMFRHVDYLGTFGLGGNGDSMLNPKCYEMLQFLCEEYLTQGKIGLVQLISNAFIPPDKKYVALIKKFGVNYRYTDYSLPEQQKVREQLDANGIFVNSRKLTYWIDTGYPQASNGIVADEDLRRHCEKCDIRTGIVYDRGLWMNCDMLLGAHKAGYVPLTSSDYINSRDLPNTLESKNLLAEFFLGYSEKGYYEYCKKCNGYVTVNPNHIDVAEQI